MEKITVETIRAIFEEAKQTSNYTNFKNVYFDVPEYKCWNLGEDISETGRQNAAKYIANNCNPEKILAVLSASSVDGELGYVLTDTAFYSNAIQHYAISYANIEEAVLKTSEGRIEGININLKDGRDFSLFNSLGMRIEFYFLEQALNKLSELCADMPESERIKTVPNKKGAISTIISCIIFLVVCFFPARCVVRVFHKVIQEDKEEKALIAQAEEMKYDKSNYVTKDLRWFETYGKSMGMKYRTDPVLIRIPNVRVFDIEDRRLDDGTTTWSVHFSYKDTNILNRLRDLYYAKARFTIYCSIEAGILTVLMIDP